MRHGANQDVHNVLDEIDKFYGLEYFMRVVTNKILLDVFLSFNMSRRWRNNDSVDIFFTPEQNAL